MTDQEFPTKAGLELPFRWWDGVIALLLFILGGVPSALSGVGVFWTQLVSGILIVVYLGLRSRLGGRVVFGVRPSGRQFLAGVGMGILWVGLVGAFIAIAVAMTDYHDPVYPDWVVFQSYIEVPITALIGTVVLAPVIEEVVFRSILYRGLLRSMVLPIAVGISAGVFGAFHYVLDGGWVRAVGSFLLSFVLVGIYNCTRSLWPAIAVHATFNGVVVLFGFIAARIVGWGTTLT